ncbi:MAG: DUF924 family protein [Polyangiaceae bacterium]
MAPFVPQDASRPTIDTGLSAASRVLAYWQAAGYSKWFTKDEAFDEEFRTKFMDLHLEAASGSLEGWMQTPEAALALVILLDQFPRNAFRATPRMFATDAQALRIARAAIDAGFDKRVPESLRFFFYLPFEHSEKLADQETCVALHEALGNPELTKYALVHREVIQKFGRFPHRNAVLGRETTEEEQAFLDSGGFSG